MKGSGKLLYPVVGICGLLYPKLYVLLGIKLGFCCSLILGVSTVVSVCLFL
jgi:hypothetical protein